jgi:D-lactate dehydrogenase
LIVYSYQSYEKFTIDIPTTEITERLDEKTAHLAQGHSIACLFTPDQADRAALKILQSCGIKLILMRCVGTDNVDKSACRELGIQLVNIPSYGPHSVAEHAVALILASARHIPQTWLRTHNGDFTLNIATMGFELYGKTVGIVGTGKIGKITAKILSAMGCKIICYDVVKDEELQGRGIRYVEMSEIWRESDIISLHVPFTPKTHHMINSETIPAMKDGVMLINTSRGGLIETKALIEGLKSKKLGSVALDVYENESASFQKDWRGQGGMPDDLLARLITFPNILITAHQAFFTREAVQNIAQNVTDIIRTYIETGKVNNILE